MCPCIYIYMHATCVWELKVARSGCLIPLELVLQILSISCALETELGLLEEQQAFLTAVKSY